MSPGREPELISLDDITIETEWHSPPASHGGGGAPTSAQPAGHRPTSSAPRGGNGRPVVGGETPPFDEHGDASAGAYAGGAAEVFEIHGTHITSVDTFSKSRVLNFIKRANRTAAAGSGRHYHQQENELLFETEPHAVRRRPRGTTCCSSSSSSSGPDLDAWRCRLRVPCPAPHGVRIAEGVAANPKDAELLCAMHAERILDAIGVPMYALASMQTKHAEAAKRQGRWAPSPGDPIRPADCPIPLPLIMLSSGGRTAGPGTAVEGESSTTPRSGDGGGGSAEYTASSVGSSALFFEDLPTHAQRAAARAAGLSAAETASAGMYDTSEGNVYQPCNLNSTRFSSSPVAITLPIVFDKASKDRVGALLQHLGQGPIERHVHYTHVAVQGTGYRMFVAELRVLPPTSAAGASRVVQLLLPAGDGTTTPPVVYGGYPAGGLMATGKALDKGAALGLAAMHAELLLDHLGLPLFPHDTARQTEHAEAAIGCGRRAPMPDSATAFNPPHGPPPLPLKQLIGPAGDSDGLGLAGFVRGGSSRAAPERLLLVHNELSLQWNNTFIEVHPDPAVPAEARRLLRAWMIRFGCKYPDLYVCTQMGDFVRATIILPLPGEYGVRGGNSIGRTPQQACELAALNAVDVLCALGIPLFPHDLSKQSELLERRRALGLLDAFPHGWEDSWNEAQASKASTASPTPSDAVWDAENTSAEADPVSPSKKAPPLQGPIGFAAPTAVAPPGYHIEGSQPRPLANHRFVLEALALQPAEYNVVPGPTNEAIVERGNKQKPQVQAYLRRTLGTDRHPVVCQTGSSPAVRNIVYLRLPLPEARFGPSCEVLAVGQALKKKDADRMCFMHAFALLEANAVPNLTTQKDMEVRELREKKKKKQAKASAAAAAAVQVQMNKKQQSPAAEEPRAAGLAESAEEGRGAVQPADRPRREEEEEEDADQASKRQTKEVEGKSSSTFCSAATVDSAATGPRCWDNPQFVAPLKHPSLVAILRKEEEMLAAKRARPRLFSDGV